MRKIPAVPILQMDGGLFIAKGRRNLKNNGSNGDLLASQVGFEER